MKKFLLFLPAILLAISSHAVCNAQSRGDERIVVGTNLVSVNVSVTDAHGRYVAGLRREDFVVTDNRVRQRIAHFSSEESPFSLGIVYDAHGPAPSRAEAVLRALKQFVGTLRPEDDYFVLAFNERGSLALDFVPTAEQFARHLVAGGTGSPVSLYDAVHLAAARVRGARNAKRALLIISDGRNHNSRHGYKELRERLREFDVQLYSIGVADERDDPAVGYGRWMLEDISRGTGRRTFLAGADAAFGRAVLDEMAHATGGTAYFPSTDGEPELLGLCAQIGLELRRQYTLGFYPSTPAGDAKWHRLHVGVNAPKERGRLFLSHRESYQPSSQTLNK